jgi:hypothetical protein
MFFGSFGCWGDWLAMTGHVEDKAFPVGEGNFSLAETVFAWTGVRLGIWPAVVFVGGSLAAVGVGAARGRARATGLAEAGSGAEAMGCAMWMLAAQLAWFHYYLLVTPLIFWALRPGPSGLARGERWWLAERAAGVLVLVVLNPWVIGALLPESRWAWPLLLNGAVGVLVGVALGEMVNAEFRMQNAELKRRAKR